MDNSHSIDISLSDLNILVTIIPQVKQTLGPGEYDLKSFLHELTGE